MKLYFGRKLRLRWQHLALLVGTGSLILTSLITLRLLTASFQAPTPQALLVLEGSPDRVRFAASFASSHPNLSIVVSGNPSALERNQRFFQEANVSAQRVEYDFCATDTVSNFTCTVDWFTNRGIHHVYLTTSDHHMQRSRTIAFLVFGSRGILTTPLAVPSEGREQESSLETLRDVLRSVVWLATGWSSANLNPELWVN